MTFADRDAAVAVEAPAQLDRIEVEQDADLAAVRLRADRSLSVHTSYRDADGALVVELPNTAAGRAPGSTSYNGGVLTAVEVSETGTHDRPLTRIVLRTAPGSELGDLEATDSGLRLAIRGTGPRARERDPALALEPLPVETDLEVASAVVAPREPLVEQPTRALPVASAAPSATGHGTADAPLTGPRPSGVVASRLLDVRVESAGTDSTVVTVVGDGEFRYSTFVLADPARFVLDLEGVVNTADRSELAVRGPRLQQIRIGQFRPQPDPVSRVVFDLVGEESPSVEGHQDGLTVVFGLPVEAVAERESEDSRTAAPAMAAPSAPLGDLPGAETAEAAPAEEWEPWITEEVVAAPVTAPVPSAPAPAPEIRFADVSLFEAQEMGMPPGDGGSSGVPPAFERLIVNERENDYVGEPISMSLKNADLVETLRSFAKISDLNFVIQPGVGGSVTVELKNVPWDQALEQILRINNLGMDIEGTIVRIAPVSQLRAEAEEERQLAAARAQSVPLRTVMRAISYASATEVATLLRNQTGSIMSSRGTVQVDARTNTLILRELPGNIDTVLAVIENLDTPEPQVSIEARIIEATKTFARSLGIEWGYTGVADAEHGNTTGLIFPNNLQSQGGVGLLTGGANGFIDLTMGNILNTFNLDARLQVAENEGLVNVVSAPRITTINNASANIQSGLQIPIQTVSNRTVSVQFVNATLSLNVTPHVTAEGTIQLNINVAKRSPQLGLAVVGATNSPIATKEAQTQVIVRDGDTAVIGGIYEVSANAQEDRVPGLANIPILGRLFKNRNRDDSNDELMIFITPRIVQL